jgi:ribosomal protein L37AE/L43A
VNTIILFINRHRTRYKHHRIMNRVNCLRCGHAQWRRLGPGAADWACRSCGENYHIAVVPIFGDVTVSRIHNGAISARYLSSNGKKQFLAGRPPGRSSITDLGVEQQECLNETVHAAAAVLASNAINNGEQEQFLTGICGWRGGEVRAELGRLLAAVDDQPRCRRRWPR